MHSRSHRFLFSPTVLHLADAGLRVNYILKTSSYLGNIRFCSLFEKYVSLLTNVSCFLSISCECANFGLIYQVDDHLCVTTEYHCNYYGQQSQKIKRYPSYVDLAQYYRPQVSDKKRLVFFKKMTSVVFFFWWIQAVFMSGIKPVIKCKKYLCTKVTDAWMSQTCTSTYYYTYFDKPLLRTLVIKKVHKQL